MDLDNPWIVPLKAWIHALSNNPWIACSIHGLPAWRAQSMDLDNPWIDLKKHGLAVAVATRVEVHGFHEKACGRTYISRISDRINIMCPKKLRTSCARKTFLQTFVTKPWTFLKTNWSRDLFPLFIKLCFTANALDHVYPFCFQACGRRKKHKDVYSTLYLS